MILFFCCLGGAILRYRSFESGGGGACAEKFKTTPFTVEQKGKIGLTSETCCAKMEQTKNRLVVTKDPTAVDIEDIKRRPQDIANAKALGKVLKVDENFLIGQKVFEVRQLLCFRDDESKESKNARIVRAVELYESLKPADGAEGMLALQMVGTHEAALDCLKRAAVPNQTFEGRDMALKHAHKLMTLYTQQLTTLNKHRGKGQQKVTVEHVNVAPGGQAIVGPVEAGAQTSPAPDPKPAVLEHKIMPILETTPARDKAKS